MGQILCFFASFLQVSEVGTISTSISKMSKIKQSLSFSHSLLLCVFPFLGWIEAEVGRWERHA
jgi:hypothetical protein